VRQSVWRSQTIAAWLVFELDARVHLSEFPLVTELTEN